MGNPAKESAAELPDLLRAAVERRVQLSPDEWQAGRVIFAPCAFSKGDLLARAGEPAERLYFIGRGLVRMFYSYGEGKEVNKSFGWEGAFVSGTLSGDGAPGEYGIEALEPTEALAASAADVMKLFSAGGGWAELRRKYLEELGERKARRERQLLLETAEERYRTFLRDFGAIAARVPQYQIALYLGITDVALSRIKKRVFRADA